MLNYGTQFRTTISQMSWENLKLCVISGETMGVNGGGGTCRGLCPPPPPPGAPIQNFEKENYFYFYYLFGIKHKHTKHYPWYMPGHERVNPITVAQGPSYPEPQNNLQ